MMSAMSQALLVAMKWSAWLQSASIAAGKGSVGDSLLDSIHIACRQAMGMGDKREPGGENAADAGVLAVCSRLSFEGEVGGEIV